MPGYEWFGEEEKREIQEVLDTGVLFRYEFKDKRKGIFKVKIFEEAFARMTGSPFALAVSSGTAALKVALAALGISPGDEVLVPGFTFVATWEAVLETGAIPVFVEIDQSLNMDPEDLPKKISPRTKAVIPVHMLGAPARIKEIVAFARKHGLSVIEDTAQACGGTLEGKYLGTFGDMGTFSFDSVKTLTTGEGGMVLTGEGTLYRRSDEYHDHGHDHNPLVGRGLEGRSFSGFNFRMMEIQGAIGLAQLAKLPAMIERQKMHKNRLWKILEGYPLITFRELPDLEGDTATFFSFFLPDQGTAQKMKDALIREKLPPIYFYENTWHVFRNWEHLKAGSTVCRTGWPYRDAGMGRSLNYGEIYLPQSDEILSRLLVFQVNLEVPLEEQARQEKALRKALESL